MKRQQVPFKLFHLYSVLSVMGFCAVSPAAIDAVIDATRISGKAPLSVYFDASTSTTHSELATRSERWHNLFVEYDFGDPTGEIWEASGTSRNYACCSPAAGHVFEEPGAYTVTATVYDGDGDSSVATLEITVEAWPAAEVICVSDNGDFTGAPAGAQQVT